MEQSKLDKNLCCFNWRLHVFSLKLNYEHSHIREENYCWSQFGWSMHGHY